MIVESPEAAIAFAARPNPNELYGIPVVLRVEPRGLEEGPLLTPGAIRKAYRRLEAIARSFGDRLLVEAYVTEPG